MSKSKMVCMGEWVRVANLRNKRFAAGNPCSRCGRLACAPVWYSLETHEVRCTRCFDAWKLYWKTDYPWVVMIGAETDWPMLRDRLRHWQATEMTEKENGMSESYDEIADYILSKAADVHVMIGPLIELMYDGTKPAIPYVAVCTGDADGQMHVDQIMCHDEAGKFGLKLAIIQRRRPVVIHDMDDELYMAKMAAALWPCAKARRILAGTEKERAA